MVGLALGAASASGYRGVLDIPFSSFSGLVVLSMDDLLTASWFSYFLRICLSFSVISSRPRLSSGVPSLALNEGHV